jgi:hypothetical protein
MQKMQSLFLKVTSVEKFQQIPDEEQGTATTITSMQSAMPRRMTTMTMTESRRPNPNYLPPTGGLTSFEAISIRMGRPPRKVQQRLGTWQAKIHRQWQAAHEVWIQRCKELHDKEEGILTAREMQDKYVGCRETDHGSPTMESMMEVRRSDGSPNSA